MRVESGQSSAAAVAGAPKLNAAKVEKVEKVQAEAAKPDLAAKAKTDQARQKEISEQAGALYGQNGQQNDIQKQQNRQLAEVA